MKLKKHILILTVLCISSFVFLKAQSQSKIVYIITDKSVSPRVKFGVDKLKHTLKKYGFEAKQVSDLDFLTKAQVIYILSKHNKKIANTRIFAKMPKEGFSILSKKKAIFIDGADESGALYGCLELADRIKAIKGIPSDFEFKDAPEMVLRGACIGVQKPYYLPGRNVYEYPYTPETFPWFYDKKLWIQYLDSMVTNRMNSLYLWNGHPFASLVKLKDYPYAVEVDEATFKKNEEIYRFLTTEADKRGIWVIQMFYNIIVSKLFAEHHKIKTQERERPIIPLISDYTRKSIAAFVEKYPNVGLMVCLGEAMEGVGKDDIEWFTQTIIPGVKDGLKALNKTEEPPIVLRAHDTDAPGVMRAALPLYKNLYTEAKFNGEALTYARPRGTWAELHQTLSKLGSVQIENIHILANLEPFRYGSPDFIQQSVIGMHEVMGGNGLHLYPQASYWDWPYSADSVKGKRLLQIERDWIWYSAWSRYAWKAKRNREEEVVYWSSLLADKFGCSEADGRKILTAYEESGEIAPKLLRRFGITDGNRQTLTLGMLMTQLINPFRYGLFTLLYDAEAPEGEMILDYADKEQKGIKHIGETPPQVSREVVLHGDKAAALITEVSKRITKNKEEFNRIANDMYCYKAMAHHFSNKVNAAVQLLKYKYTNNVADLELAVPMLEKSVNDYKELARLTSGSYLYANSMQTQQRKIPMRGINGTFKHWNEMLPVFETELKTFQSKLDSLKNTSSSTVKERKPFQPADVKLNLAPVVLNEEALMFSDTAIRIKQLAAELKGLKAIQFSYQQQLSQPTEINFYSDKPVKILVGYFKTLRAAFTTDTVFAKAPELETNASADDYGQSEIKISNAIALDGMPPVNIHTYSFKAGTHTLKLPKGVCLVLGFVDGTQIIPVYDAMLMSDAKNKNIDWLFD